MAFSSAVSYHFYISFDLQLDKIKGKRKGKLQAFKRPTDGHKITVKISSGICVVLSWDELKVRQNLLDSDYEI